MSHEKKWRPPVGPGSGSIYESRKEKEVKRPVQKVDVEGEGLIPDESQQNSPHANNLRRGIGEISRLSIVKSEVHLSPDNE